MSSAPRALSNLFVEGEAPLAEPAPCAASIAVVVNRRNPAQIRRSGDEFLEFLIHDRAALQESRSAVLLEKTVVRFSLNG